MKKVLAVFVIVSAFYFTLQQQSYAQESKLITPTLYCLGGVPCNAPLSETGQGRSHPTVTPTINQTPAGNNLLPQANGLTATTEPCVNNQSALQISANQTGNTLDKSSGGFFKALFEFLLKLLQLIMEKLGLQQPSQPGKENTTVPCVSPTIAPTTLPDIAIQPTTAANPTTAVQPTSQPVPQTGKETPDPSDCKTTAAEKYGWGQPQYQSDFTGNTLDPTWHPYGPEPGHAKRGERTPEQIKVADGNVTLYGAQGGKTAAMKWFPGQRYGRWEGCMKASRENAFHALFLHWSDDETFSKGGGEIDWAEIFDDRNKVNYFLHCGGGGNCDSGSTNHDVTQWTAYALEWTPTKITTYINGTVWKTSTNASQFPPRPMNWCIQLDWFGASGTSWMSVDWTKQYAIKESIPSTLGLKPGEPATGQPGDYPNRKPRPMSVSDMLPK